MVCLISLAWGWSLFPNPLSYQCLPDEVPLSIDWILFWMPSWTCRMSRSGGVSELLKFWSFLLSLYLASNSRKILFWILLSWRQRPVVWFHWIFCGLSLFHSWQLEKQCFPPCLANYSFSTFPNLAQNRPSQQELRNPSLWRDYLLCYFGHIWSRQALFEHFLLFREIVKIIRILESILF